MRPRALAATIAAALFLTFTPTTSSATRPPAPGVSVSPSTDLVDGQNVTISGTNFVPDSLAFVAFCVPGAIYWDQCDLTPIGIFANTDSQGGFTVSASVQAIIATTTAGTVDCTQAPGACVVGAGSNPDEGPDTTAPLSFAPPTTTVTVPPAEGPPPTAPATTSSAAPAQTVPTFTG